MRPRTAALVFAWFMAEGLRVATTPAATRPLRSFLAACETDPRTWPAYAAWGVEARPGRDAAPRQQEVDGCGAAALAAVLIAHGRDVRQSLLWSLTRLPGGGTSAARLARIGTCFGLECTVHSLGFDAGVAFPAALPAVVHLRRGHFVVLRTWGSAVHVFDPACGGVWVRPQTLQRRTSGFVVTCVSQPVDARMSAAGGTP